MSPGDETPYAVLLAGIGGAAGYGFARFAGEGEERGSTSLTTRARAQEIAACITATLTHGCLGTATIVHVMSEEAFARHMKQARDEGFEEGRRAGIQAMAQSVLEAVVAGEPRGAT